MHKARRVRSGGVDKKKTETARSLVRYDTKAWAERRRREEATTGWSETGGGET